MLTGSEEAGLRGAKNYAEIHEKELKEIETVVIACDTMRDLKDMACNDCGFGSFEESQTFFVLLFEPCGKKLVKRFF